jgi:hypothetical protein
MSRRAGMLAVTLLVLAGCGGRPPNSPTAGFTNRTRHSDADLQAIWLTAQQSLAQSIDLNPLQQADKSVPPDVVPGDARALNVKPDSLLIEPVPDVSSQTFFGATGVRRAAPTGMIPCPKPCNARFAPAYSSYQPLLIRYAASWDMDADNFRIVVEYEFENHILHRLGYDTKWR